MADVVDKLPDAHHRPGESKYEKYFDGQVWRLVLGEDCPADMNIAQNAIRITAKRKKIAATIRQSKREGVIYVQAHLPESKPAKRSRKSK